MEIQTKLNEHPSTVKATIPEEPVMKYIVISTESYQELSDEVNKKIRLGWEPLGGLSDTDKYCAQAMIKPRPWSENGQSYVPTAF